MKNQKPLFSKSSLISIFLITTLSACSGQSDDNGAQKNDIQSNGYTPEMTKGAVEQCMLSGATQELCECITTEIQARIPADELKEFEARMQAGEGTTEEFTAMSTEAAMKCIEASRASKAVQPSSNK